MSTYTLGLSGTHDAALDASAWGGGIFEGHDAAAVLLRDGEIVAAIEEERLNRIKHTNRFPREAIRACLDLAGITLRDVARIGWYYASGHDDEKFFRLAVTRNEPALSARELLSTRLEEVSGIPAQELAPSLSFVNHHTCHLLSAALPAPFAGACLTVSIDGFGGSSSGLIAAFDGARMEVLRQIPVPLSLGHYYEAGCRMIGYRYFDEYKFMGLAPYGDAAVYRETVAGTFALLPDGQFMLKLPDLQERRALWQKLRRPRGAPFTQDHMDWAAAYQGALEQIVLHMLRHFQEKTGLRRLALAGGVAHNCTLNGVIARSGLFDEVFVQPAAHDAGAAFGAALACQLELDAATPRRQLTHLYHGKPLDERATIEAELEAWRPFVEHSVPADIFDTTADLLARGAVVGWCQGRSEFGPRSLGNRSILADPRPPENKDRINAMVKKREGFRPFAPSVVEERAREYFEWPASPVSLPFMIFVVGVRPEKRKELGAITHVDGTARVQTVSREQNERYWRLLSSFGEKTGTPMLLNTSFNNHAEPIVDSVFDAITCFLTTDLEYLVLGDVLVKKRPLAPGDLGPLTLSVVPSASVEAHTVAGQTQHRLVRTFDAGHDLKPRALSAATYAVLLAATGTHTVTQLLGPMATAQRDAVLKELYDLWGDRVIELAPLAGRRAKA